MTAKPASAFAMHGLCSSTRGVDAQQIDPYENIAPLTHPWLHIDAFASSPATRAFSPRAGHQRILTTVEVFEK